MRFPLWHGHPHPTTNKLITTIIMSDVFFWSAWSTILPLLSVFTIQEIPNATIQTAALAYSTYIVARIVGTLISGILFSKSKEITQLHGIIGAIFLINISYIGFAFIRTIPSFFLFNIIIGLGVGIATPLRATLFSTHLDKNKETVEWATLDSIILVGIAICAVIAGAIINNYGFTALFLFATVFNCLSIFPYLVYKNESLKI